MIETVSRHISGNKHNAAYSHLPESAMKFIVAALVVSLLAISGYPLPTSSTRAQPDLLMQPSAVTRHTPQSDTRAQAPMPPVQIVGQATAGGETPALRILAAQAHAATRAAKSWPARRLPGPYTTGGSSVVQRSAAASNMPAPLITFDGINNRDGFVPSDSNGAVGPHHYVELVNMQMAVYSITSGALLFGPVPINTIWSTPGTPCATTNDGDPIVLYDQLADRWLVSEFSVSNTSGPYYECVAVSTSPDPAGSYNAYAFQMPAVPGYPNGKFPDYPKLAVWPDAYYMTMNQFASATGSYAGAAVWALNRSQMLTGVVSPTYVYYDLDTADPRFGNMLPANLDGATLPPAGSPEYFAEVDGTKGSWLYDAMRLWRFSVNWATPASSTFGLAGQPNSVIAVAPFNYLPCVAASSPNCIPQPGSAPALDAVGDRIMHRLVYRNFGDHEALVANQTVDAGGGLAGIRWYEVRDPGGSPSIYQQGTFAPDATNRWMGSIAMDRYGNIAVGYSASSATVTPSIRYAGRLATDPLGALSQGEQTLITGTGVQLSSSARWGDYSSMSIDPTDDCTFWYVNQYYDSTGFTNWRTRIGSFRLPPCNMGGLTGVVTDASTSSPLSNVLISTISPSGFGTSTLTDPAGAYTFTLPADVYTVTASIYGYMPATVSGVSVTQSSTTTQAISLTPIPYYVISGTVSDSASGQPLTATIQVTGSPYNPPITATTTDASGYYSFTLLGGQAYTLTASADFHPSQTRPIATLSSDRSENFALWRQIILIFVMKP